MKVKPDNMTWWEAARTITTLVALSAFMLLYRPDTSKTPYERQQEQLQKLIRSTSAWATWGQAFVSDAHSTWYEKLRSRSHPAQREPVPVPLDVYGHPLVYEPPTPANGQRVIVRSVGKNGIDDNGRRDDLQAIYDTNTQTDTMPKRNFGYWIATDLPEPLRWAYFILIPTAFALMGWVVISHAGKRHLVGITRIVAAAVILSAFADTPGPVFFALVFPFGFIMLRVGLQQRRPMHCLRLRFARQRGRRHTLPRVRGGDGGRRRVGECVITVVLATHLHVGL